MMNQHPIPDSVFQLLPKFPGRYFFDCFKEPIEIGDTVEATIIRNLDDGFVGVS